MLQGYIVFFALRCLVIIFLAFFFFFFCFMLICCICFPLQYSAVDSNPLSIYVMHPFWNFVVKVRKLLVFSTHNSFRALSLSIVLWHVKLCLLTLLIFRVCLSLQFLPTWLAPNLITFTGFMFLVLNFVMLAFYDFDFYASGKCSLRLRYFMLCFSNEVALWLCFPILDQFDPLVSMWGEKSPNH